MKKILCITTGLTGILHASYKVVALLENAGYEVTYACPWDVREKVERQGFTYRQLDKIDFDPASQVTGYAGKISKLLNGPERRRKAAKFINTAKFEHLVDEVKPDLVLLDMELHDLIITAVAGGVPTILLSQWFSVWKNSKLPPLYTTITPDLGPAAIKRVWRQADVRQFLKVLRNRVLTGFTDRASVLREYARAEGFPVSELSERYGFPPPFTYRTLPVISLTDPELEFPHERRKNLFYAGAMVYEKRRDERTNPQTEEALEKIFKACRQTGAKLIYCTLSTMDKGDELFTERLIKAVSAEKNWQTLIGLGGFSAPALTEKLPDNVHVFTWLPQLKVLEQAACSINHGGIHTINECIHFGVPMLIYPGKKHDQNGCAARVAFHGLGLMADKDLDDASAITERIRQILEDPSYAEKVAGIRSARAANENRLLEIIEKVMTAEKNKKQSAV